jgi:hypothetical protein
VSPLHELVNGKWKHLDSCDLAVQILELVNRAARTKKPLDDFIRNGNRRRKSPVEEEESR